MSDCLVVEANISITLYPARSPRSPKRINWNLNIGFQFTLVAYVRHSLCDQCTSFRLDLVDQRTKSPSGDFFDRTSAVWQFQRDLAKQ